MKWLIGIGIVVLLAHVHFKWGERRLHGGHRPASELKRPDRSP